MEEGLQLLSIASNLDRLLGECDLGLVVTDFRGTILEASPKMVEITGYSASDLVGANPRLFRSGQTPDALYKELWTTIRSGSTWKSPLINRRKGGRLFLDRESIVPIDAGTLKGARFIAVHREANEERELQAKLVQAGVKIQSAEKQIGRAKLRVDALIQLSAGQAERASLALIAAMEARDPNTAGHGQRTALLMDLIGETLGLFERYSRDAIRIGAILHDFGKIGIPDSILLKAGKLTDPEFEVMKQHATIGFDILRTAIQGEEALRLVRHHHERLDGSGYPDGLTWNQIPDYVKVFSVIDCFDAMSSKRTYRGALPIDAVLSSLTDDALSGRLDRATVKALNDLHSRGVLSEICGLKSAA